MPLTDLKNPKKHSKKTKNKAYAPKSQPKPKEREQFFLPMLYLEGIFFVVFLLLLFFFKSYVLWNSNTFFFFKLQVCKSHFEVNEIKKKKKKS